jgi:hypothetical protein|tara:strand:- start:2248 stop:2355 length:108 start_codon:yes stop_codon:yes gene_type:complete
MPDIEYWVEDSIEEMKEIRKTLDKLIKKYESGEYD